MPGNIAADAPALPLAPLGLSSRNDYFAAACGDTTGEHRCGIERRLSGRAHACSAGLDRRVSADRVVAVCGGNFARAFGEFFQFNAAVFAELLR